MRPVAPPAIALKALDLRGSLVHVLCVCGFGDCGSGGLGVRRESHRILCAATLFPESLDLFERGLKLLRVGCRTRTVLGSDFLVHATHGRRDGFHPTLVIALALCQRAEHDQSRKTCQNT